MAESPNRPEIAKALRKAGLSSRQVKRLLYGGWKLVVSEEQLLLENIEDRLESLNKEFEQLKQND